MSDVKNYVEINISRETARVTQTGFGTTLIVAPHYRTPATERIGSASDPSELLSLGFLITDPQYIAANKLMSQQLSPPLFKYARKMEDVNSKATLAFTGTPTAGTWTLTIGIGDATPVETGNITYSADDDTAAIEAAIEALAGITEVTVTGLYSTGYTIEFTGVDAAKDIRVTAINVTSLTGVTAATVTQTQYGSASETWGECIATILAEDPDWYFLNASATTEDDIKAISAIIEAELKMYFCSNNDADIKNDVASNTLADLKDLSYDRTSYLFSEDYANYPESGLVGGQSPKNPGSLTWKFKNIVGISPDTLTTTEFNNITGNNGNTYETVGGINMMSSEAVVVSGEYIDIIRGTDWLQTRMSEDIFSLLANVDKIPFTNPGIGAIEAKIWYWLRKAEGQDVNLLVPGQSSVNMPKLTDISTADKLARYLRGITFSGKYAGAVHKVGITGKLSV